MKRILKPAAWAFYFVIVFEILFMISPFAVHFYSAYGPALNLFHRWPSTAWLTQFFLPHFSQTDSRLLNAQDEIANVMIFSGATIFFAGAVPLYWAKLRRRGAVIRGLYALIRHPQYVGLAVVGLGTVLLWPRFLVLVTYVTMLCLYAVLARWEEERCLARFGETYSAYQARTGMFLPRALAQRIPTILPVEGVRRLVTALGICAALVAAAVALGLGLRDHSISKVSAMYTEETAVLSPAVLTDQELGTAYGIAAADPSVQDAIRAAGASRFLVYVVPEEWYLPDLPIEAVHEPGGHRVPEDFDRRRYKILFTRARTFAPEASGRAIVTAAYGRDPIILAKVDISGPVVTGIERPPPHVVWGDIPTPMF